MIYVEPNNLWETWEANKSSLPGRYITLAEDSEGCTVSLSEEEGELLLIYQDVENDYTRYETAVSEDEAVYLYEGLLAWLAPEEDDAADDGYTDDIPPEIPPDLQAATAAWLCVALETEPKDLGMDQRDIEFAAREMLWAIQNAFNMYDEGVFATLG